MRYATGGGLTAAERERRERVRLEAAERFERGETNGQVAAAFAGDAAVGGALAAGLGLR